MILRRSPSPPPSLPLTRPSAMRAVERWGGCSRWLIADCAVSLGSSLCRLLPLLPLLYAPPASLPLPSSSSRLMSSFRMRSSSARASTARTPPDSTSSRASERAAFPRPEPRPRARPSGASRPRAPPLQSRPRPKSPESAATLAKPAANAFARYVPREGRSAERREERLPLGKSRPMLRRTGRPPFYQDPTPPSPRREPASRPFRVPFYRAPPLRSPPRPMSQESAALRAKLLLDMRDASTLDELTEVSRSPHPTRASLTATPRPPYRSPCAFSLLFSSPSCTAATTSWYPPFPSTLLRCPQPSPAVSPS